MKRLAVASLLLLAACESQPSKLNQSGTAGAKGGAGDDTSAEADAVLARLEDRIAAIEEAQKMRFGADGKTEAPVAERLQRVEASLLRYSEALGFLQKVYEQQKAQQEAQEAKEPDPTATFAVDIGPALAAGQVEGPNTAMVTIIEAWDFA